MDSLTAYPYAETTLEAEDLIDSDPEEPVSEASEEADDDEEPPSLRDQLVGKRFSRWLEGRGLSESSAGVLKDMFARLEVLSNELLQPSSERRFEVKFKLAGIHGLYVQRTQADTEAPVWDTSSGQFEELPFLSGQLEIDGENVIECRRFVPVSDPEGTKSTTTIKEELLGNRFGSQVVEDIGGQKVLLQFLGIVCADAGALRHINLLPFGLVAGDLSDGSDPNAWRLPDEVTSKGGYSGKSPSDKPKAKPPKPKQAAVSRTSIPGGGGGASARGKSPRK